MTSSQQQEASTEELLPLGPLNFEIRSSTNRVNPETQHEETYYLVRFLDFDNEEQEFSETRLMMEEDGVQAVLKYNGTSPTTKEALQCPRRVSRKTSIESSPLTSIRRVSELRSSDQSRDPAMSLPPQNTGLCPAPPQSLDIEDEGSLDALEWANQNHLNVPELPEWQRLKSDLSPAPLVVDSAEMVRFEHVAGPSWTSPGEGVATVELPGQVLIKFHNGTTALLSISEATSGDFTTMP